MCLEEVEPRLNVNMSSSLRCLGSLSFLIAFPLSFILISCLPDQHFHYSGPYIFCQLEHSPCVSQMKRNCNIPCTFEHKALHYVGPRMCGVGYVTLINEAFFLLCKCKIGVNSQLNGTDFERM